MAEPIEPTVVVGRWGGGGLEAGVGRVGLAASSIVIRLDRGAASLRRTSTIQYGQCSNLKTIKYSELRHSYVRI